jgi:hypothetical protein
MGGPAPSMAKPRAGGRRAKRAASPVQWGPAEAGSLSTGDQCAHKKLAGGGGPKSPPPASRHSPSGRARRARFPGDDTR